MDAGRQVSHTLIAANKDGTYTVASIAHAAGMSERTVYHRFAEFGWRTDELHRIKRDPHLPTIVRLAIVRAENDGVPVSVEDADRPCPRVLDVDRNGKVDARDGLIHLSRAIESVSAQLAGLAEREHPTDQGRREATDRLLLARTQIDNALACLNPQTNRRTLGVAR